MVECKLILLAVIVHFCCVVSGTGSNNSMLSSPNQNMSVMPQSNVSNVTKTDTVQIGENDLSQAMNMCNESYQIPINYMEEMNMTGSYPDETEKSPMCFMKCYLENVGALSSDNNIAMNQALLHFATNEEVISSCLKEQSDIDSLDPCEYAHFLARCIMMSTLLDNRKSDT